MARVSNIYSSPWLRADDLQGRSAKVEIAHAGEDAIRQADGSTQPRIVVDFVGKSKRLILNATQARTLVNIAGDDTDLWRGREVILSPVPSANGKYTIAIMPVASVGGEDEPF